MRWELFRSDFLVMRVDQNRKDDQRHRRHKGGGVADSPEADASRQVARSSCPMNVILLSIDAVDLVSMIHHNFRSYFLLKPHGRLNRPPFRPDT